MWSIGRKATEVITECQIGYGRAHNAIYMKNRMEGDLSKRYRVKRRSTTLLQSSILPMV